MKDRRQVQMVSILPQLKIKEWEYLYGKTGKHQWQKLSAHAHKILKGCKK